MKVCIFLANGFEEGEAVNTIDVLRRAKIDVDVISVYDNQLNVLGSHSIKITADFAINQIKEFSNVYDCFILPGGPGVNELVNHPRLKEIFILANQYQKYLAAICAAPKILLEWKILDNHQIVHYPNILTYKNADLKKSVMIDRNIITGKSIGTSIDFALLIVETLLGKAKANEVQKALVIK